MISSAEGNEPDDQLATCMDDDTLGMKGFTHSKIEAGLSKALEIAATMPTSNLTVWMSLSIRNEPKMLTQNVLHHVALGVSHFYSFR